MTFQYKYVSLGAIVVAILVIAFGFLAVAKANPSFFMRQNNGTTTTATTSVVYMSPGAATTTYSFDAGAGAAGSTDGAVFTVQLIGSSTATTLNIAFEYSQDNVNWYNDRLITSASTTQTFNLNSPNIYQWSFSSTSVQGGVAGITTTNRRIITVPTPTRYVRAVLTLPAGSLNGSVWGEFIGKRQGN